MKVEKRNWNSFFFFFKMKYVKFLDKLDECIKRPSN